MPLVRVGGGARPYGMRPIHLFPVAVLLALAPVRCSAQGTRRPLTRDSVIDGIPCAPTGRASVEFHANGRLLECPLARDTVMWGQALPAGTWVRLLADGRPDGGWLSRDAVLSGIRCRGDGYKAWAVRFHPSGVLSLCFLRTDTVVDGVPCLRGTFLNELRGRGRTGVVMDDRGRLRQCMASRTFTRHGVTYHPWDVVTVTR